MKESEFLDLVGRKFHNDFMSGADSNSNSKIGFKVINGKVVSFTVDGVTNPIGSDLSDLEHHEARFRINYQLKGYHAAEYHLWRILAIKIELMKRRYCQ
jgi:hypothetical protein